MPRYIDVDEVETISLDELAEEFMKELSEGESKYVFGMADAVGLFWMLGPLCFKALLRLQLELPKGLSEEAYNHVLKRNLKKKRIAYYQRYQRRAHRVPKPDAPEYDLCYALVDEWANDCRGKQTLLGMRRMSRDKVDEMILENPDGYWVYSTEGMLDDYAEHNLGRHTLFDDGEGI